jgi:hypothetical protein
MLQRILTALLLLTPLPARAAGKLAVHEWGTFTSLQDETGRTLGGINVEDEPVPAFVHSLDRTLLIRAAAGAPAFYQGAPASHPDVTMRLETPVIYFHPPPDSPQLTCDVAIRFPAGWLSQFYPNADSTVTGPDPNPNAPLSYRPLTAKSSSTLTWKQLRIGPATRPFPETKDPVWLAPRDVRAADVSTPARQSERFLFYRGVAHLDAPLQVTRSEGVDRDTLWVQQPDLRYGERIPGPLWFVDVRPDGQLAYRRVDDLPNTPPAVPLCPAAFADADFSPDRLAELRAEMHAALTSAGLFPDEADALLNTWQLSYFKSPGQRLFFLAPRAWTDRVLPLDVSAPADVTRVMVARIELVTPHQRALLQRLSAGPTSDAKWYFDHLHSTARPGATPPTPPTPPADYQAWRDLGRFREALLLDELSRRPTEPLKNFINNYNLEPRNPRQN